jgi:hypothetical protein
MSWILMNRKWLTVLLLTVVLSGWGIVDALSRRQPPPVDLTQTPDPVAVVEAFYRQLAAGEGRDQAAYLAPVMATTVAADDAPLQCVLTGADDFRTELVTINKMHAAVRVYPAAAQPIMLELINSVDGWQIAAITCTG